MQTTENEIAREIVDAALLLHKRLGPGLLESVYEVVLAPGADLPSTIRQETGFVDQFWSSFDQRRHFENCEQPLEISRKGAKTQRRKKTWRLCVLSEASVRKKAMSDEQ